jgi:hypothetical protein
MNNQVATPQPNSLTHGYETNPHITQNNIPHQKQTYKSNQFTNQETNQEMPESSSNRQNNHIPNFSYYPETIIEDGLKACQISILGKIITDKVIYTSSIQSGLENIWGAPKGLKIQEVGGNILQFFMENVSDQDRILQGNPWIFRNSWLIVKPWNRETDPRTIDFDHAPVWIQLWGLPPHCKTKAMGQHLGSLLGEVEAFEIYEYPGKKMIVKIKVAINVHQPISAGIHVGNPTDGTSWVDFRFEKLPQVCFHCGLIGHSDKQCKNQAINMDTMAPLGPWIRSNQYGRRKMAEKDRQFFSNPSQSPNFGTYSPSVPASLLSQLAAMKINNPQNQNNNTTPKPHTTTSNQQEKGKATFGNNSYADMDRISETPKEISDIASGNYNQAKRLKMAEEVSTTSQPMAGLEFQASQQT